VQLPHRHPHGALAGAEAVGGFRAIRVAVVVRGFVVALDALKPFDQVTPIARLLGARFRDDLLHPYGIGRAVRLLHDAADDPADFVVGRARKALGGRLGSLAPAPAAEDGGANAIAEAIALASGFPIGEHRRLNHIVPRQQGGEGGDDGIGEGSPMRAVA